MLRKAVSSDIPKLAVLYAAEMTSQFRKIGEKPLTAQAYRKILKKNVSKGTMYVLDDGNIIGFLWYVQEGTEFNLEEIFVTEKGRGHGRTLMEHLFNEARRKKIKRINLDVHFKNLQAQDFFKGFGFSERTVEMSLDLLS